MAPEFTPVQTQNPNHGADSTPESMVDIRNIEVRDGVARPRVLGEVEHLVVQDRDVAVYFGPVLYRPDPGGLGGDRIVFGVSVTDHDGQRRQLLQHVAAPLRFDKGAEGENWHFEREMLKTFPELSAGLPADDLDRLVVHLPGAEMTEKTIYESTAAGVGLGTAVHAVMDATHLSGEGRITDDEAHLIVQSLYDSSISALQSLHKLERMHRHPHPGNFNARMAGRVTLMDYSAAAPVSELVLERPWRGNHYEQDVARFKQDWKRRDNLPDVNPDGLPEGRRADADKALEKLEPAIVRYALSQIGIRNVTDREVGRIITAQRKVVDQAPTIAYPQEGRPMPAGPDLALDAPRSIYDTEADVDELLFEKGHRLLHELLPVTPEQPLPPQLGAEVARHMLQELAVRTARQGKLTSHQPVPEKGGIKYQRYTYGDGVNALLKFETEKGQDVLVGAQVSMYSGGREYWVDIGRHKALGRGEKWDITYHLGEAKGEAILNKKNVYGAALRGLGLVRGYAFDRDL